MIREQKFSRRTFVISYRTTKYCIIALLIAYGAIGFWTRQMPKGEYYPFFSWILFDRIPETPRTDYTIRITAVSGRDIEPPPLFKDARRFFSSINNSPPAYQFIIRDLGAAIEAGDTAHVDSERRRLEENFTERPLRYEILKIHYDPIAFWTDSRLIAAERLASFESGAPQ